MARHMPAEFPIIITLARKGFKDGNVPTRPQSGVAGETFLLHDGVDVGREVAVFKPTAGGTPQRDSLVPGDGCRREVAVYFLDHGGFAGVPMTMLAEAEHPEFPVGVPESPSLLSLLPDFAWSKHSFDSLQGFVPHEDSMNDLGGSNFDGYYGAKMCAGKCRPPPLLPSHMKARVSITLRRR